jgi:hypothetical protein
MQAVVHMQTNRHYALRCGVCRSALQHGPAAVAVAVAVAVVDEDKQKITVKRNKSTQKQCGLKQYWFTEGMSWQRLYARWLL